MGMTINERYTNACIKYLQKNMECVGYRDYIIERLNKYQKIVQIMERTVDDGTSMYDTLQEIEEVIEDENVD